MKRLTLEMINASPELQGWIDQFPSQRSAAVTNFLLQLQFVSRDEYAEWLKKTLTALGTAPCALYSVRKFDKDVLSLWDVRGEIIGRPGSSQGSEDLVQSVVAGLVKSRPTHFLDHPSIETLREKKIHEVVLIDDSIGSGQRVTDYLQRLMANKSLLSWWSFGWIRLQIVAFARSVEAEARIIDALPGSDHPLRKRRKSQKIGFVGDIAFHEDHLTGRWGDAARNILELCESETKIPRLYQCGWGGTMANIVFYHSVPDNLPGILWYDATGWSPLFPNRSVPQWLPRLLEGKPTAWPRQSREKIPEALLLIIRFVRRGIRSPAGLARMAGVAPAMLRQLIASGQSAGFLTRGNRLTEAGVRILREAEEQSTPPFDRSLYIPQFWCVGQGTVQPSAAGGATRSRQTNSVGGLPPADGGAGQAPLERTDAKTASPSLRIMAKYPAKPWDGHDTHGPLG